MGNILGRNVRQYAGVVLRGMEIGDDVVLADGVFAVDSVIGNHCTIERRGMVFGSCMGDYSYTGYHAVVKHARIGKFCSLSWNVSIGGADHDYRHITTHPFPFDAGYGLCGAARGGYASFERECKIGNDVWIGANAVVTRGVRIGDGAVVGASAVVTHDIPAYEIWAGVPARRIGQRFSDEIIRELLEIKWWDAGEEKLGKCIPLFSVDATAESVAVLRERLK